MVSKTVSTTIDGLFFGKIEARWEGRPPSAIGKTTVDGLRQIKANGFVEDAQADLDNHGGAEKAIHHYPSDHYAAWMAEGVIPEGTVPAAFGENISAYGLTEDTVCIGDVFQFGSAIVQISQGRQPCWKVAEHTSNSRMAYLFQKTGRTGWYYRIIENGKAGRSSEIRLLERPLPDWTVKRVTQARLFRNPTPSEAETLANLPELAQDWRGAFAKMAGGDTEEDTSRRLQGLPDQPE